MFVKIKVRNIGNSVGIILPKELGLVSGDIIQAEKKGNLFILDTSEIAREHDRKLVEDSFANFEKELIVSESKMKAIFGKYGWK
ncbi:AbrB family transcriptional regulator [Ligilactobacillus agilis]|uniref:AbrB family transcriptional regulator n=1 Tax=Ligilactobacillus agilis TaxID=1601 RepID=A0A9Q9MVM5_9LACO|nr:AbrB family transcriptional regulator [Ligilactobacillus agilis]MCL8203933.1 AbrB family transcriptional regulator [Ligilactobacillus agilis]MDM8279505.1 AbrB family transcriptional regulator [Ligilactobacillus agilis]UXC64503.1 AbrB family transcriptional regulator [Ligilactobacillus agilis]UXC66506.1 AbrB family transcriptional regulator [Ligilactobacillus agilis]